MARRMASWHGPRPRRPRQQLTASTRRPVRPSCAALDLAQRLLRCRPASAQPGGDRAKLSAGTARTRLSTGPTERSLSARAQPKMHKHCSGVSNQQYRKNSTRGAQAPRDGLTTQDGLWSKPGVVKARSGSTHEPLSAFKPLGQPLRSSHQGGASATVLLDLSARCSDITRLG